MEKGGGEWGNRVLPPKAKDISRFTAILILASAVQNVDMTSHQKTLREIITVSVLGLSVGS